MHSRDGALVAIAVAGAALAAISAGGHPTGVAPADLLLQAAFAAGVTLAASRSRHWTWIVIAAVAAALSPGWSVSALAGWLALLAALAATIVRIRHPAFGAATAALASVALLRLPPGEPGWLAPAAVAIAVAGLAGSAYRAQDGGTRRRVRRAAYGVTGFVAVAAGGFGTAAATSARAVDTGAAEARAGMRAMAAGDPVAARDHLRTAVEELASADRALGAWYTRPARLVPVLGQQAGAVAELASVSHELAAVAADAATRVDRRSVTLSSGRVDLAAVAALETPLADVEAALGRAEAGTDAVGSDWVVPPIRHRHSELRDSVRRAHADAHLALAAVRQAPELLGAHGPRRYLIAFTTPAEARGIGGFAGNFAELTANDGRLEMTRSDRIGTLTRKPGEPPRELVGPPDFVARYGSTRPQDVLGDATQSPDFPSVAQVLRSSYRQAAGTEVDGVILADPYAIAGILRLTGPVPVEGLDAPLTADNAVDMLLRGQYERYGVDLVGRGDFLAEAARAAFDALLDLRSVEPSQWAATLGPLVEQRRLLAWSARPDEQRLFAGLGLAGSFPPIGDGDFFGVTTTNFGNNKIDAYLHRAVAYRAEWDPVTGELAARATVTLRNDAPDRGLSPLVIGNRPDAHQPDGTNWLALDLYSPHQLQDIRTRDGAGNALPARPIARQQELGRNVYRTYVAIPPGDTVAVTFELRGTVVPSERYGVRWFQQPSVHPDAVTVTLDPTDPWTPRPEPGGSIEGEEATVSRTSDRDGAVSFDVTRPAA